MVTSRVFGISLIVAFLVGCAAGFATGAFRGSRAGMALVLNSALTKDAREVEARIAILNHLRAGEQAQAIEKLEAGLDDILIGFDPDEPYPGLDGPTVTALRNAIDEAKAYRAVHPWPSTQKNIRAEMVGNLFARDLYKGTGEGR